MKRVASKRCGVAYTHGMDLALAMILERAGMPLRANKTAGTFRRLFHRGHVP